MAVWMVATILAAAPPGEAARICQISHSGMSRVERPWSLAIRSPTSTPALAAGLSAVTATAFAHSSAGPRAGMRAESGQARD